MRGAAAPVAGGDAPAAPLANPALKSELLQLVRRDQEIRRAQLRASAQGPSVQDVARLSAATTDTIRKLFAGRFPSVLEVGSEGVVAAFCSCSTPLRTPSSSS